MRKGFNPESLIWKPLGHLGDLVMLSLLWTVFCLPVVTVGPASAALYDAAVHGMRRNDEPLLERFLSTFKRELKQGVLATLPWLAIPPALFFGLDGLLRLAPSLALYPWAVLGSAVLLCFFLLCVQCWLWPTLSRFEMKLGALLTTSLRLAFGHILRSAAMAILWGAVLWTGLHWVFPLFVGPGLAALLCSFLIEPVFRRYEEKY
jgi:uncharacterized membrane protein YesL